MRLWTLHPRYLDSRGLVALWREARARGYEFDARKIGPLRSMQRVPATSAQIAYEWAHLLRKLRSRDPGLRRRLRGVRVPLCHPLFRRVQGPVAPWECRGLK